MHSSVESLKGIGPKRAAILREEAGIETVEDLLYYIPRRYIDRSSLKKIGDCFVNELVTVAGRIIEVKISGNRKKFLEVIIDDDTEVISGVFFGGINYFKKIFSPGDFILFSGTIGFFKNKQIVHPEFDFIDEDSNIKSINTGRIIPLYPSTEKLKEYGFDSRGFRRAIRAAIDTHLQYFSDNFPDNIIVKYGFPDLRKSLFDIHFPENFSAAENARRRLAFNEIFFLQYYLALSKRIFRESTKRVIKRSDGHLLDYFIKGLPFQLTNDQKKSITEISQDLASPFPMNRMLQGDVGSGKTAVAMAACAIAKSFGEQSSLMAPTEVLANQHYESFRKLMPPDFKVSLITGSTTKKERDIILSGIASGQTDILIGTHALIEDKIIFRNLGLIIIDEQHRFGVNQRSALRAKGKETDLLVMTATPIPRSLSMTLYGDLEISHIKEKPADRIPVKTISIPESKVSGVYKSIEKYISYGRQVFYVLPLIEESEKTDLKSAVGVYENLKNIIFNHRNVGLLHGKLKQKEKDQIMQQFKDGSIDILVSTTVIEVGIDVPNANVMIIHHPERFGLSQLHQLRGRVGRGAHESYCVLLYPDKISEESKRRMDTIVSTDDGFAIAEEDLQMRGAGELTGTRQHGLSEFEFTDLAKDYLLIMNAREEAVNIVSSIENINGAFDSLKNGRLENLIEGIRTKRILGILS